MTLVNATITSQNPSAWDLSLFGSLWPRIAALKKTRSAGMQRELPYEMLEKWGLK